MIALMFRLMLKEPVLATGLGGDPNSAVSLPYVPGSLVRGALIGRYLKQNPSQDLAADPDAQRLFFDDKTRFLNAYLQDPSGVRTLPTPRSWKTQKRRARPIYDLSVTPQPEPDLPQSEVWQPTSLEGTFCTMDDDEVILHDPKTLISIHTQRDRVMGRATEESGAVFRYEALAPGQTFSGAVLCQDEESAGTLTDLLSERTLFLGGSRHAGYGLVQVDGMESAEEWQEAESEIADVSRGDRLRFTLLSDALLRDPKGHYVGTLTSNCLRMHLRAELTLDADRTHASSGIIGGFNRKWGLPLPQAPVAQAGSVYTFTAEDEIPAARIQRLLDRGIGERRAEGFGRLACNWHGRYTQLTRLDPLRGEYEGRLALSDASREVAERMANRMLRHRLDRRLRECVNDVAVHGDITNTQLSQISVLVRSALSGPQSEALSRRLSDIERAAGDQFRDARVGQQSLLEWLRAVLDESPTDLWRRLFRTDFREDDMPAVGGIAATWGGDLRHEYALRLIDGVISRELDRRRSEHA